jgi:hypothetical protein
MMEKEPPDNEGQLRSPIPQPVSSVSLGTGWIGIADRVLAFRCREVTHTTSRHDPGPKTRRDSGAVPPEQSIYNNAQASVTELLAPDFSAPRVASLGRVKRQGRHKLSGRASRHYLGGGGFKTPVSIRTFHVSPSRTSVAVQMPMTSRGAPLSDLPVSWNVPKASAASVPSGHTD